MFFVQSCVQAVENITSGVKDIDKDGLLLLCNLPDSSRGKLFSQLRTMLLPMKNDPVVALLTLKNKYSLSVEELFDEAELNETAEVIFKLVTLVLSVNTYGTVSWGTPTLSTLL